MPHDPRAAWLLWLRLGMAVGARGGAKLLNAFGLPENIFAASPAVLRTVVPESTVQALLAKPNQTLLQRSLDWLEGGPGRHLLTLADAAYPQQLLTTADPPLFLFAEGRLDLLQAPAIAIVGSRNATTQGLRNAGAFAEALSAAGLCIISGLALGIDAAGHEGGLRGKSGTIAVIGTGPDLDYPEGNLALARRIRTEGCLLTEFFPGTPPLAENFPRRNRIISGSSRGVLVVEAAARSGTLITARFAGEQGRDVFAIPGSIHAPLSRGCHALIKQGAKLVDCAADVLDELGWHAPKPRQPDSASDEAEGLLQHIGFDPVDLDTLAARAGLDAATLAARLLPLELAGQVEALPGGRYQRLT